MQTAIFPDLLDRSVLITGGGSGIGAALTEGFVRQGSKVAFIDIAEEISNQLVQRLIKERVRHEPVFLNADLRDAAAVKRAVDYAAKSNGPISVLINNAGWDERHTIDADVSYWDNVQAINLRPHYLTAQLIIPGMKKLGGGSIINFTSTAYMINGSDYPAYAAAKAGVVGLTKGLAGGFGPDNIRVNAIAPGWVMTDRQREKWVTEEKLAAHLQRQCLKQPIQPEDLVGPCLFLASDSSRMMTAQVLIIDAGSL